MESNRDEAYRCIELTKCYILKKDLDNAWKFSVKANKLFPSPESKLLMRKLKNSLKKAKRHSKKHSRKKISDDSDSSYNGDESSSSQNNCNTKKPTKKSKRSHKSSSTAYSFDMFKEINKDESLKCFEKAEEYIRNNQFELAIKFLLKSNKLFALPKTNELLEKIQESKETIQTYTEEQANIVKKVKNSENYYAMLGIKINASITEIKSAYKKLALLLHPDKNPAPGSGEVFVDLSNAVNTLCDNTKRTIYDQKLKKPTSTFVHFFQSSYRQSTSYSHRNKNSNPKVYQNFFSGTHSNSFYDYYANFEEEEYCSTEDIYNDYYDNYD